MILKVLSNPNHSMILCDEACKKATVSSTFTCIFDFKIGRETGDCNLYLRARRIILLRIKNAFALLLTVGRQDSQFLSDKQAYTVQLSLLGNLGEGKLHIVCLSF